MIDAGTSLGQAVAGLPLFGCRQALGLIRTGEASGTLPRMLLRYSAAETAAIDRFDDLRDKRRRRLPAEGAHAFRDE